MPLAALEAQEQLQPEQPAEQLWSAWRAELVTPQLSTRRGSYHPWPWP